MTSRDWPAWFNGPNNETRIFNSAGEVPPGWTSGAEKRPALPGVTPVPPSPPPPPPPAPGAASPASVEIDAHGHPWSADLHAASKSKTTAGLWRMKVGKSRPAPLPGYPLDL